MTINIEDLPETDVAAIDSQGALPASPAPHVATRRFRVLLKYNRTTPHCFQVLVLIE